MSEVRPEETPEYWKRKYYKERAKKTDKLLKHCTHEVRKVRLAALNRQKQDQDIIEALRRRRSDLWVVLAKIRQEINLPAEIDREAEFAMYPNSHYFKGVTTP